jgi:hypothetical protein
LDGAFGIMRSQRSDLYSSGRARLSSLGVFRQIVHTEFHSLATRRLVQEQLDTWRGAFDLRGKGSTFERAQEIRDIYEEAAPVPRAAMTDVSAGSFAFASAAWLGSWSRP